MGFGADEMAALGITGSCAGGSVVGGASPAQTCPCTCAAFEQERSQYSCRRHCSDRWQARQCHGSNLVRLDNTDPDINAYMIEVRKLGLGEDAEKSHHLAFQQAPPDLRARLRDDIDRQLREKQKAQKARLPNSQNKFDAETLRYMSAIEQLGLAPDLVDQMTDNFQRSNAATRAALWQQVKRMLKQKK